MNASQARLARTHDDSARPAGRRIDSTTRTWLKEFYADRFCPAKLGGRDVERAAAMRLSIKALQNTLGRVPPRVADLNRTTLRATEGYLERVGYGQRGIRAALGDLTSLWRFAHTHGVLPRFDPPRLPPPAGEITADSRLADFLEIAFWPNECKGQSAGGREQYRYAVRWLGWSLGRRPGLCDLTRDNLHGTVRFMFARRAGYDRVETIRRRIITLWRYGSDLQLVPSYRAAPMLGEASDFAFQRAPKLPSDAEQVAIRKLPAAELTLSQFLEAYYIVESFINSPATLEAYRGKVRFLDRFHRKQTGNDEPLKLRELSEELIVAAMNYRINTLGQSPYTANTMRGHILAMWKRAWQLRLIDHQWRLVRKARVTVEEPEAWSGAELASILTAAGHAPGKVGPVPAGLWWTALLRVICNTGARVSAVMAIRTKNVDLDHGTLRIEGSTQKQRRGQTFELLPETVAAVVAIDPSRNAGLFDDWPYDRTGRQWQAVTRHYRKILRAAGIAEATRRDLFHKLRRTVATGIAAASDETTAQRVLGHSTVAMTRRYIDTRKVGLVPLRRLLAKPAGRADDLRQPAGCADDNLTTAMRYFEQGEELPAGCAARIALSNYLRRECESRNLRPASGKWSIGGCAVALHRAGHIDHDATRLIRRLGKMSHRIAHGGTIGPERLSELVQGVRIVCEAPGFRDVGSATA